MGSVTKAGTTRGLTSVPRPKRPELLGTGRRAWGSSQRYSGNVESARGMATVIFNTSHAFLFSPFCPLVLPRSTAQPTPSPGHLLSPRPPSRYHQDCSGSELCHLFQLPLIRTLEPSVSWVPPPWCLQLLQGDLAQAWKPSLTLIPSESSPYSMPWLQPVFPALFPNSTNPPCWQLLTTPQCRASLRQLAFGHVTAPAENAWLLLLQLIFPTLHPVRSSSEPPSPWSPSVELEPFLHGRLLLALPLCPSPFSSALCALVCGSELQVGKLPEGQHFPIPSVLPTQ